MNENKYETWISQYSFDSPYEEIFLRKVLLNLPINIKNIKIQHPFIDTDNKQRYCDFTYTEGNLIKIAIEIDGYDKRGTGTGMSKTDFIDWQRRQASLTAAGWRVIRFANTDVRDHSERCQHYLELLLQKLRASEEYQKNLIDTIYDLRNKINHLNKKDQLDLQEKENLKKNIKALESDLAVAKKQSPLNDNEITSLKELQRHQENYDFIQKENKVMKTTIWAITLIAITIILSATYIFSKSRHETPSAQSQLISTSVSYLPAECQKAINWQNAFSNLDKDIAIQGIVKNVTHRPQINGRPTYIDIGGAFPDKNRLTLVIWGDDLNKFNTDFINSLKGKKLCILGKVKEYKNIPQVFLNNPKQIYEY